MLQETSAVWKSNQGPHAWPEPRPPDSNDVGMNEILKQAKGSSEHNGEWREDWLVFNFVHLNDVIHAVSL